MFLHYAIANPRFVRRHARLIHYLHLQGIHDDERPLRVFLDAREGATSPVSSSAAFLFRHTQTMQAFPRVGVRAFSTTGVKEMRTAAPHGPACACGACKAPKLATGTVHTMRPTLQPFPSKTV